MKTMRRLSVTLAAAAVLLLASFAVPAVANAAYGAIAVNTGAGMNAGASGVSYNYRTKDGAKRRAERECPGQCRIAVWVRNQCGAVVETPTHYIPGTGPNKRAALASARRHAHNPAAPRVAWVCSG